MIVHLPDISFPSLSANNEVNSAASQQLAAVLILYTYKNTYKLPDNLRVIQMRQYHRKSRVSCKIRLKC